MTIKANILYTGSWSIFQTVYLNDCCYWIRMTRLQRIRHLLLPVPHWTVLLLHSKRYCCHFMLGRTFYVTFIPVTVCECHNELKATWLDLTCFTVRFDAFSFITAFIIYNVYIFVFSAILILTWLELSPTELYYCTCATGRGL